MPDATFVRPDLSTFCRLDELGLEVTGQRLERHRAVLARRVVEPDRWCRRCGCEGAARDTVVRRLSHEPLGWRPTILEVTVRRYRCTGCGQVWRQDTTAAAEPRAKLSRRALRWALEALVTWRGHVEVEYVALDTLRQHSTGGAVEAPCVIARVSPGEYLHLLPATPHRILGWSLVRRYGRSLIGPPAQKVIPSISEELNKIALLHHVRDWPVWVREMATAGGQAYVVLSLCRTAVFWRLVNRCPRRPRPRS